MPSKQACDRNGGPPGFVQLVGHPVRWRLLAELVQSDRAVRELTDLLDESQSLVSYHLRRLRDGGLVSVRRSAADGRDSYYSIDLAQCREQLQAAGGALHPSLWLVPAPRVSTRPVDRTPRVLFLCTGNSARSQMAEALLVHRSGGTVAAASAGSAPKPLHADAVRVMRDRGIDVSGNRTKHWSELADNRFDLVVTLCDRVREVCPGLPEHPRLVHWSMPDPSAAAADDPAAFERTADELELRIGFLLDQLDEPPTRRLQHAER